MATNTMSRSQPQWRFERPHRVRLFSQNIHFDQAAKLSKEEVYWQCAENFSKTGEYKWVEDNSIALDYSVDDYLLGWHKVVMFYADLTEEQYVDYALRFFKHGVEWK